jgi:hypothetical protein
LIKISSSGFYFLSVFLDFLKKKQIVKKIKKYK